MQHHEILDVDHINQQDIDVLKQAYCGVSPILEQLDNLSYAGLVSLYLLYEHIWDEVNLKMKFVKMTNYKNRRQKNMKFTTGWKKVKETNEALREIVLQDAEIFSKETSLCKTLAMRLLLLMSLLMCCQ